MSRFRDGWMRAVMIDHHLIADGQPAPVIRSQDKQIHVVVRNIQQAFEDDSELVLLIVLPQWKGET